MGWEDGWGVETRKVKRGTGSFFLTTIYGCIAAAAILIAYMGRVIITPKMFQFKSPLLLKHCGMFLRYLCSKIPSIQMPSATDPSQKNKVENKGRECTQFLQIGCFFHLI